MKKKMISLTIEENKSYQEQKVCYICKKEFSVDDKNIIKSEIFVITLENMKNIEVLPIIFVI